MLVSLLTEYIIDKFNQNIVDLKSAKKDPLGNNGKKLIAK
tara:strand:+ start:856 stop:975 length:120 start_codon:yes stop_codon:yes gene_type:complete